MFLTDCESITGSLMKEVASDVLDRDNLNYSMASTPEHWRETREYLKALLSKETPFLRGDKELRQPALHPKKDLVMHSLAHIDDYTVFMLPSTMLQILVT